jgi:hypothetical protein
MTEGLDWITLAQNRDKWRAGAKKVTDFRVPQNAGHFFTGRGTISFSRKTVLHGVNFLFVIVISIVLWNIPMTEPGFSILNTVFMFYAHTFINIREFIIHDFYIVVTYIYKH